MRESMSADHSPINHFTGLTFHPNIHDMSPISSKKAFRKVTLKLKS